MKVPVVELRADLSVFGSLETAATVLETFVTAASAHIEAAVLDPEALMLPDGYLDEPAVQMIERVNLSPLKKRKFFVTTERAFDVTEISQRKEFVRLAYCSALANVWSVTADALFESADYGHAAYYLTEDLKAIFYAGLADAVVKLPPCWPR